MLSDLNICFFAGFALFCAMRGVGVCAKSHPVAHLRAGNANNSTADGWFNCAGPGTVCLFDSACCSGHCDDNPYIIAYYCSEAKEQNSPAVDARGDTGEATINDAASAS